VKIIQETKTDSMHKVNNFIGESFDENTTKGKKNKKFLNFRYGTTNNVTLSISNL